MWINAPEVSVNCSSCTNHEIALLVAVDLYDWVRSRAFWSSVRSKLTGRSNHLLNLAGWATTDRLVAEHYLGVHQVPIDFIRGSEGRSKDFDVNFHPLQEHTRHRWLSIAMAHEMGETLPPVELIQVDDTYFVRDGHHRISVAKARGQAFVEGHVTRLEVQPGDIDTPDRVRCAILAV